MIIRQSVIRLHCETHQMQQHLRARLQAGAYGDVFLEDFGQQRSLCGSIVIDRILSIDMTKLVSRDDFTKTTISISLRANTIFSAYLLREFRATRLLGEQRKINRIVSRLRNRRNKKFRTDEDKFQLAAAIEAY